VPRRTPGRLERRRRRRRRAVDAQEILPHHQFEQEKPAKFPRTRIGHAYDALRRANLVG
jgi:hypothetical protein